MGVYYSPCPHGYQTVFYSFNYTSRTNCLDCNKERTMGYRNPLHPSLDGSIDEQTERELNRPLSEMERSTQSPAYGKWSAICDLQREVHRIAVEHGWWEEDRNFGEMLALVHSEISEALEAWREGQEDVWYSTGANLVGHLPKPEGVVVELADAVIRILDIAEERGVDLGTIIVEKMRYNETREYRHGGKRA